MIQDCCKVRTPPSGQNAAWGNTGFASSPRAEHSGSCSSDELMGGAARGTVGCGNPTLGGAGAGRKLPSSPDYETRGALRRTAQAR